MWRILVSMWKFFLGLTFGCCYVGMAIVAFGYTLSYASMGDAVNAVWTGAGTVGFFAFALVIVFRACQKEDEELPLTHKEKKQITPEEFILLDNHSRRLRSGGLL